MVSWPRIHFLPGTCGQQSIEGGQWTYFFVGEAVFLFDSHMKFLLGTFSLHVIILDIHTYYLNIYDLDCLHGPFSPHYIDTLRDMTVSGRQHQLFLNPCLVWYLLLRLCFD